MPLLRNVLETLKIGWNNLNKEDNLTLLTFVSVLYVFLIVVNSELISSSIFSNHILLFNVLSVSSSTLFLAIFAVSGSIALFIGSIFRTRYNVKLQLFCSILGLMFGFLLYLPIQGELWVILTSIIGGFVAGLGIPNILAAFLFRTNFTNRGSTCGLFTAQVFLIVSVFSLMIPAESSLNSLRQLAIILVILKIFSLLFASRIKEFVFESVESEYVKTSEKTKFWFILIWIIFNISDAVVQVLLHYLPPYVITPEQLSDVLPILGLTTRIIGLLAILVGGILLDLYGRKRLLMFSYAFLGVNYAVIALSRGWLFYFTVFDGVSWGIITVMFLLVVWGDICHPTRRTFWISLPLAISLLSYPGQEVITHLLYYFSSLNITIIDLFPITSVLLFVAVVVILSLPETLPEKIIQKKELDDYIHMAKKVKEKYKKGKKS